MKKGKRILAMAGVVILAVLYIITLVSAIFATPATKDFFLLSLVATILIPLLVYIYMLIARLIFGRDSDEEAVQEVTERKGFDEAFGRKKEEE